MQFIKVSARDGQKVKKYLMDKSWLSFDYDVMKEEDCLLFSINENADQDHLCEKFAGDIVERDVEAKVRLERDMKTHMAQFMTEDELLLLKTAYDIVGDIAVLEIEDDIAKYEKEIAKFILETQKNVHTVLKKAGNHGGDFRTQDLAYVAGVDTRETIHKENGVRLKLEVGNVYFSMRQSTERGRVTEYVQPGERVLIMFSGCGPFTCVIAKNTKAKEVVGVEWNPKGFEFAEENVKLNKITNVKNYCGDVYEVLPKIEGEFDRIFMPLPKSAGEFLDIALTKASKGTVIHMYDFLNEDEFHLAHEKIERACKEAGVEYKLLRTVKCGQHAPYVFRICVDFEIL